MTSFCQKLVKKMSCEESKKNCINLRIYPIDLECRYLELIYSFLTQQMWQKYWLIPEKSYWDLYWDYKGSPTSRVSTSTNSTCTNFSAIGVKFVLVEFLISKFILVEFSLCTQLVRILHSTIFSRSQNRIKWGPPVFVISVVFF